MDSCSHSAVITTRSFARFSALQLHPRQSLVQDSSQGRSLANCHLMALKLVQHMTSLCESGVAHHSDVLTALCNSISSKEH